MITKIILKDSNKYIYFMQEASENNFDVYGLRNFVSNVNFNNLLIKN